MKEIIVDIIKKALIIINACLLLNACGKQAEADTPKSTKIQRIVQQQAHRNLLEDKEELISSQRALYQLSEFKGKDVYIYNNIDFFDGIKPRIELEVQNPNVPTQTLSYRYEQSKWTRMVSDNPQNIAHIDRNLTNLKTIHFEDVVQVSGLWKQKAKEVHAVIQKPYYVSFIFLGGKNSKRFWHTAEIEAVGAQYYLSVNLDGTVWEFKKL